MKANIRACIAYAAGRIILQKESCKIFDCAQGREILIDGVIGSNKVDIYNREQLCNLGGLGYKDNYELFNFNDSYYVELVIEGSQFKGYDFGNFSHFMGEVKGENISFFDHELQSSFDYSL